MSNRYNLKKTLDVLYKRKRMILNDIEHLKKIIDFPDTEDGKKHSIETSLRIVMLRQQERYNEEDITEILGDN